MSRIYLLPIATILFAHTISCKKDNTELNPKIYICGKIALDGDASNFYEKYQACYWVNSQRFDLPNLNAKFSDAYELFVNNDQVYIAGRLYTDTGPVACY
ncbi:MAG: hypothetical protein WCX31_12305 [Salinivirgaceae bacterium]|jgi:hypothetical protein